MLGDFLEQGTVAFAILGLGLTALVAGLVSFATRHTRNGHNVGIVALALVVLGSSLGFASVTLARARTENVAKTVEGPQRRQIREAGYAAAKPMSVVSFGLGVPAFGLAATAVVIGIRDRRRAEEKRTGEPPEWPVGGAALCCVAFFSVVATGMPLAMSGPGATPTSEALLAVEVAETHFAEGRAVQGCEALNLAYQDEASTPKDLSGKLESLISECFRQRVGKASNAVTLEERRAELGWLRGSKLPLSDQQKSELSTLEQETKNLDLAGKSP